MRRVVIESPYAGDIATNVGYARAAVRDALLRGEAPICSHLLFTQPGLLDDGQPEQRALGIEAGLIWGEMADATIVYSDRGISPGMQQGIDRAQANGRPVEYRSIEWHCLGPFCTPRPCKCQCCLTVARIASLEMLR